MCKIKIKNLGPIKEGYQENDGWIDIKKVTVFIGNQGSGKSTLAKAISTLSWLEKSLNRGDTDKGKISFAAIKKFFEYQKIHNYFSKDTFIEYIGEKYHILYDTTKEYPIIKEVEAGKYLVPKIMYIPAERSFLSAISDAFEVKGLPGHLFTFGEEFRKAQFKLSGGPIKLPFGDVLYEYDKQNDTSYIVGKTFKTNLLEASSGYQSFIPVYVVLRYLSMQILSGSEKPNENMSVNKALKINDEIDIIINSKDLSDADKLRKIEEIKARFVNKRLISIVEEPEQNLFPSSQHHLLHSLLTANNLTDENKLIITTHSPYLINYLTLAVKAEMVNKVLTIEDSKSKLNQIVPLDALLKAKDLLIYQLNEIDGSIKVLPDYKGLPSDENYLNSDLEESNELFAQLQEIEKGWR